MHRQRELDGAVRGFVFALPVTLAMWAALAAGAVATARFLSWALVG